MEGKNSLFLILLSVLLLVGCDTNRVFEKNVELQNETWDYRDRLKFDVDIQHTDWQYNFLFNFRHRGSYPYRNFYFFFHMVSPSGETAKDTVHCMLADPSGKWLGTGSGNVIDNQILFKHKVLFQEQGTYHFEIEQGMRDEKLTGVLDAGLRIEKAI